MILSADRRDNGAELPCGPALMVEMPKSVSPSPVSNGFLKAPELPPEERTGPAAFAVKLCNVASITDLSTPINC